MATGESGCASLLAGDERIPWDSDKPYYPPHIYLDNRAYFITAGTFDRRPLLATDDAKSVLREELRSAVEQVGIELVAWVILDNHYHVLVHIKSKEQVVRFTRRLHSITAIRLNRLHAQPGRRVWRNYWDYCPRNEKDFYRVLNYIHINPAKHGVLSEPIGLGTRSDGMIRLSGTDAMGLHERLLGYTYSSYASYVRQHGHEGMAALWRDYPIPEAWQGDEF